MKTEPHVVLKSWWTEILIYFTSLVVVRERMMVPLYLSLVSCVFSVYFASLILVHQALYISVIFLYKVSRQRSNQVYWLWHTFYAKINTFSCWFDVSIQWYRTAVWSTELLQPVYKGWVENAAYTLMWLRTLRICSYYQGVGMIHTFRTDHCVGLFSQHAQ